MVPLEMSYWCHGESKGRSVYRIGTVDMSDVNFPPNDVLETEWDQVFSKWSGALRVFDRGACNCITVEIPARINQVCREKFVDRLSQLVQPVQ